MLHENKFKVKIVHYKYRYHVASLLIIIVSTRSYFEYSKDSKIILTFKSSH